MSGLKRSLEESSHDGDRPSPSDSSVSTVKPASPAAPSSASSFRNVSACNRCRLRKNRCDQRLPSCASCDKASVKCVGYDPITKREIPRRYEIIHGRSLLSALASAQTLTSVTAMSTTLKPASHTSRHYCKSIRLHSRKQKTSTRPLRPAHLPRQSPYLLLLRRHLAMAPSSRHPPRSRRRATSMTVRS